MAMRLLSCAILSAGLLTGCLGSGPGAAVLNTGVALGYTAHKRSRRDGCWAACPPGTICNTETGFCDRRPCAGRCKVGQECRGAGANEMCVEVLP
jgi:hypothetical protein